MFGAGLRRAENVVSVPAIEGQNSLLKDLDLNYEGDLVQNGRFPKVGEVKKRPPLSYYNTGTAESNAITSCYRYYNSISGTEYLIQLNGNTLRVGDDSARTFSTLHTFSSSSGYRFTAVTYKGFAIISTGKDPIIQTDGVAAWELGSCKATLGSGAGNLDQDDYKYTVVFNTAADGSGTDYINGAESNTITCDASNQKIELTNIPLGPTTSPVTLSRVIYRTEGGETSFKKLAVIGDNTTTTYSDNIADGDLTDALDPVTDDVPYGAYLAIIKERLFVSGDPNRKNYAYYSDLYKPHWFETGSTDLSSSSATYDPGDHYEIIGKDDGDIITGIVSFLGNTYVYKQNSVRLWNIYKTPEYWTVSAPISVIGSPAPYSIAVSEFGILSQGWDKIYLFNGQVQTAVMEKFTIEDNILPARISNSFGFYWNGIYLLSYTDYNDGNAYNDKVLWFDFYKKMYSIDKFGLQSSGTGSVNLNCFTALKGEGEWNQLFAGDSVVGRVYEYDAREESALVNTKTTFDSGTYSDTIAVGSEADPVLTKITFDRMEYSSDSDARAAWVTSETTEKVPYLGDGSDSSLSISSDTDATAGTFHYTSVTVDASKTWTIPDTTTIYCQGAFTCNGSIKIKQGTFTVQASSITVGAAGIITTDQSSGLDTFGTSGTIILRANTLTVTAGGVVEEDITGKVSGREVSCSGGNSGGTTEPWDLDWENYYAWINSGHTNNTIYSTMTFDSTPISRVKYKMRGVCYDGGSAAGYFQLYYTAGWHTIDSYSTSSDSTASGTSTTGWAAVTKMRMYSTQNDSGDLQKASVYHNEMRMFGEPRMDYINGSGVTAPSTDTTDFENALESYSSDSSYQGTYALEIICAPGAITTDEDLKKTLPIALDVSNAKHDNILIDVKATRTGSRFQLGLAESSDLSDVTYVNVPITAANTWETATLDFSGMADANKNAIKYLSLKFTDTDSYNQVYVDNIRTGLGGSDLVTEVAYWTSPVYNIEAARMGSMYWNENLAVSAGTTYGNVLVSTRTGDTSANCIAAAWSTALTNPAGSPIASTADKYFQFKVGFCCNDATGVLFPYVYLNDNYVVKATYYRGSSAAEQSVVFRNRTGYRNFGEPLNDKIFRKIVSLHEGESGTFNIKVETDLQNEETHTFTINLSDNPKRWSSNFPSNMFGKEIRLEWYKDDIYDFKVKQYMLVLELIPEV